MAGNRRRHDEDNFIHRRYQNGDAHNENEEDDEGAVGPLPEVNRNVRNFRPLPVLAYNYPPSMAHRMQIIREENVVEEMLSLSLVGYQGCTINRLITYDFINLMDINLHGVQLTTLEGFPPLPNLRRLNLSYNLLYDGFEHLLHCRLLQFLDISQNLINDFDDLLPLRELRILQYLSVLPRRLRSPDFFHERLPIAVFNSLVHLQYLDMRDRNGVEIQMRDIEEDLGFDFV